MHLWWALWPWDTDLGCLWGRYIRSGPELPELVSSSTWPVRSSQFWAPSTHPILKLYSHLKRLSHSSQCPARRPSRSLTSGSYTTVTCLSSPPEDHGQTHVYINWCFFVAMRLFHNPNRSFWFFFSTCPCDIAAILSHLRFLNLFLSNSPMTPVICSLNNCFWSACYVQGTAE